LLFYQCWNLDLRICVTECLLAVLSRRAVDIEHNNILLVDRVLYAELRSLDFGDIAQITELRLAEDLFFRGQGVVLFSPLQRCKQLRLCLGQFAFIGAEELLKDNERGVGSC
jgi:hypothetical protein